MKGFSPKASRTVFSVLAITSVLAMTVAGVAISRNASAGLRAGAPTGVLAHGTRTNALHSTISRQLGAIAPTAGAVVANKSQSHAALPFWNAKTYAAMKAGAAHNSSAPRADSALAGPSAAQFPSGPSVNNPDVPTPANLIYAQGELPGKAGVAPADMGLAAGNGYIVQAVNDSIAVYTSAGVVKTKSEPITTLFGAPSTNFQSDPRVMYDAVGGHFFVLMDDIEGLFGGTQSNFFYVAVSKTNDPSVTTPAGWITYLFDTSENLNTSNAAWADFPMMGMDSEAIYLSGNRFTFSGGSFADSFVLFASKAQLEAGTQTIPVRSFSNLGTSSGQAFAVHPAIEYGNPRAELMVDTDFDCATVTCNTYDVWSLSDPLGATPVLSWVKIGNNAWAQPPTAFQKGDTTTASVDTGDPRVSATPIWRNGSLYFGITSAVNNGSGTNVAGVLWFNLGIGLDTGNASCGTVPNRCVDIANAYGRENGQVIFSGTTNAFYPALAVDTDSNIVISLNTSSKTTFPGTAVYGRRATTLRGTLGLGAASVVSGAVHYLEFPGNTGPSPYRFGDYTAAALDAGSCTVAGCFKVWVSGMYARADGGWGTSISSVSYDITNP